MTDFTVVPEQVREQAQAVRGIATGTAVAADAACHVTSLDDAYGWICQAMGLPELLRGPQEHGARRAVEVTAELVEQAEGLADTAETYQRAEDAVSETLRKLLDMLDRAARAPKVGGR
ncbi:type VII secretion target [Actinosynnema sp. NPDC047251]|uniref:Uncharacterized protein n=1 Tax=Saccharothrix espanaensis (strain ATCC 51144 / DSM 44229 / JCM 9112 / NBRC 15066 / NRRL 15764) TaxID=1179773 RepID=K0JYM9_SACES|nr:type VII secretion target [Saccharothrix espanaensis]CCH33035.1 hypothetical protein BN6_57770 [Saccharothrix espanaensis DSM 44229]